MAAFLLIGLLSVNAGCAVNRASATLSPDADLAKVKSFYVVKRAEDDRGIERLIRDNLAKRGLVAQADAASGKPDALVTYVDKWMWDITMYMIELTITLRDPQTNFPLATGNSYHTSLTRKSSEEMVDEVVENIFKGAAHK